MKVSVEDGKAEALLKRALFLAYEAVGAASGMGVLQAARLKGQAPSEERVWKCIISQEDYDGFKRSWDRQDVYADYVFGRMVKWGAKIVDSCTLEIRSLDELLRPDYQGFAHKYPTARALLDAAAGELSVKYAAKEG